MTHSFDEILDITDRVLRKAGFSWIQVLDTKKLNGDWEIKVNVGVGSNKFLTLIINDGTGEPKSITETKS